MSQAGLIDNTSDVFALDQPTANVNALPRSPILVMAAVLRTIGTDLDNERAVIHTLINAKFASRQVVALMTEAVAFARTEPAS